MKFKIKTLNRHLMAVFGGGVIGLTALTAVQAQGVETVTITGSSIKRSLDSQQALPVSVYSVDELKATGVTSVEEVVSRISASQGSTVASSSVGSGTGGAVTANLRGLGSNKTLVLLNGRRLAFFGIGSSTVDLNAIPFAALDRVEVLRESASAIYGTDAVGGVINFITKRSYKGADVTVENTSPTGAGGDIKRGTFSAGFGDFDKDGHNVWFSVDNRKQASVRALDRSFAGTGVIPARGLNKTSGTSFPGNFNFYDTTGAIRSGNITRASGCVPPASLPLSSVTCRYDYTSAIDIIPETDNVNLNARGSFKLDGGKVLTLEAVNSRNQTIARVAPDPVTGMSMPTTSPYYPSTFSNAGGAIDPTRALFGVGWRMVPGGQRENTSQANASRVVADLTGTMGAWDYKAGVYTASSQVSDGPTNGYVSKAAIQAGVTSGLLNPFGANTDAGMAAINAAKAFGTFSTGKGTATGADLRVNRDMFKLDGGMASVSIGLEKRRESYNTDTDDTLVVNVPSAGRSPYHVNDKSRDVTAMMAEAVFPVTKQLELTAALRSDNYSDFGNTTNPKAAFRYKAASDLVFRGSASKGFRAPALDDLYGPQSGTYTSNAYDDPVLCPGGTPAAGGIQSRDCGQQPQALTGGNPALQPETSKAWTLGTAFKPNKDLLLTVDYWNINVEKQLGAFPEQLIFASPVLTGRITRCNTLTGTGAGATNNAATWERCGVVAGSSAIAYINALTDNLGDVKTRGFDFSAAWSTNVTDLGRLSLNWDATLVNSYQYQRSIGDAFVENVGKYVDASPVIRWRHFVNATVASGASRYSLGMRHFTGYTDENLVADAYLNQVKSYTTFDAGYAYTGIKNLTLGAMVRNILNTAPPFSNQGATFQQGYDPRYTDPLGRALVLRATYKF